MWAVFLLWACTAGDEPIEDTGGDTADPGPDDCVPAAPPPSPRVIDGAPSQIEAVVSVNALYEVYCSRAGTPVCTGALIDERTVLTSAHCLRTFTETELGVVVSSTGRHGEGPVGYELEGILYYLDAVQPHPAYDEETQANDVALLTLSEPVSGVEPLALSTLQPGVGEQLTVVGYGRGSDAVRTEGTVSVSELQSDRYTYVPDPSMTCGGDSGGPVLKQVDGVWQIVGVTVAGDADCEVSGDALNMSVVAPFVEER